MSPHSHKGTFEFCHLTNREMGSSRNCFAVKKGKKKEKKKVKSTYLPLDTIDSRLVLDYLYGGEVNIDQKSLGSFLKISSKLKIEGLQIKDIEDDNDDEDWNKTEPVKGRV